MVGLRRIGQPPRINRGRSPGIGRLSPAAVVPVPAVLTSAVVENATPSTLTAVFNKNITSANYIGGVSISIDGTPVTGLASSTVSPSGTIVFTFTEAVVFGDLVTFNYTPGDYTDADTLPVAAISNFSVTNNVLLPAPVFSGTVPTQTFAQNVAITPVDFSTFFTGTGITYSWENGIPAGLSLDPSTGILSGTPTTLVTDTTNLIRATNSGGSADSNNFEVTITAGGTVSDKAFEFGVLTSDLNNSGYVVVPDSGTITSITIDSASLGDASDFTTVGDEIRLAGGNSFTSDTTLNCTANFADLSTDTFVATAEAVADGISVGTTQLFEDTGNGTLAYGHEILLRENVYNNAANAGDLQIRRFSNFTGTFDGSNHVVIRPSAGENVTIRSLQINNDQDTMPAFLVRDITFQWPTGGGGTPFNVINSGGNSLQLIVDNLTFPGDPTYNEPFPTTNTTLAGGFRLNNGGNDVTVRNCTFATTGDIANCIFVPGDNILVEDNTLGSALGGPRADAIRIGGSNVTVRNNHLENGLPISDSDHNDYIQSVGAVDNHLIENNTIGSGNARSKATQGIFYRNSTPRATNVRIRGNRVLARDLNNGIVAGDCDGAIVEGNSVGPTLDSSIFGDNDTRIRFTNSVNSVARFNVASAIAQDASTNITIEENFILTETAQGYTDVFNNVTAAATASGTEMDIVAASPPDVHIPRQGAHQAYFDPVAGTSDAPYAEDGFTPSPADLTDVAISTPVTVNQQVTGVSATGVFFYITGGNSATFDILQSDGSTVVESGVGTGIANARILDNNQFYRINDTSSASNETQSDIVIIAGVQTDTWSFTTAAAAGVNRVTTNGNAKLQRATIAGSGSSTQFSIYVSLYSTGDVLAQIFDVFGVGAVQTNTGGRLRLNVEGIYDVTVNSVLSRSTTVRDNVLISFNSATQVVQVYVNDSEIAGFSAVQPTLNASIDWYSNLVGVFGGASGTGLVFDGDIEVFNFEVGTSPDFSVEATRRLYHAAGTGEPVTSLPGSPDINTDGPASEYNTGVNNGSGGTFTVQNTFSDVP